MTYLPVSQDFGSFFRQVNPGCLSSEEVITNSIMEKGHFLRQCVWLQGKRKSEFWSLPLNKLLVLEYNSIYLLDLARLWSKKEVIGPSSSKVLKNICNFKYMSDWIQIMALSVLFDWGSIDCFLALVSFFL